MASSITTGRFWIVADAQDGHVRLVDHRQAHQAAVHAGIGDGEGAFLDLLRA